VSGALGTTDCRFDVYYTDFFELAAPTGPQGLTLTMTSLTFDTYLDLYQRPGGRVAFNDDIDTTTNNSRLNAIVPAGNYLIAPSSFLPLQVGAYSLTAQTRPVALSGCTVVWTTRGIVIGDSVTTADCVDSTGGPHYADIVALYLEAGSVLKVLHQSAAFDAALFLENGAGVSVASNNDSANATTTTNAYLVYPVVLTGPYLLFVATHAASATGPYTLTISSSTTLSGSPWREGPQLLRVAPLRMRKGRLPRAWFR
jgi:hypothetical protein